tara:strand:- start:1395 stop:2798 length:1404 start_codon:yes stop_codon:yes gene_type:complete
MHEHSSKWIGGQDVHAATLKDAMLQLGEGAQSVYAGNAGVYNLKEHQKMASSGAWNTHYAPTSSYRGQSVQGTSGQASLRSAIIRSGRLVINGNFCGLYDFAYIDGNTDLDTDDYPRVQHWFTRNEDTHWALIYVNGTLNTDWRIQIKPPVRKLGMCIYTDGDFTHNGLISMTGRGANHSGTGNSGGYTAPVAIAVKSGITIPATGGTGGSRGAATVTGATHGTDAGATPSYGSGGGGSGVLFPVVSISGTVYTGAGSAGTCFTGGSGGGSIMRWSATGGTHGADASGQQMDAVANGGAGGNAHSSTATYGNAGGAGNPAGVIFGNGAAHESWSQLSGNSDHGMAHYYGYGETVNQEDKRATIGNSYYLSRPYSPKDTTFDGTAGTVVIMVDGTWSGGGKIYSEGGHCPNAHDGVSGCGSGSGGGGIAMVLSDSASGGPTPSVSGGPDGNNYAGSTAGAGTATRSTL